MQANLHKQIADLLLGLHEAERCGDTEAAQKAYEDLFALCRKNNLDLEEVIRQPQDSPAGLISTLKAIWPMS